MGNVLFLGSRSPARQELLRVARIPFKVVEQNAAELQGEGASLDERVLAVAREKMAAVCMPVALVGMPVFVLTADTLVADAAGEVYGKPRDFDDARRMLRAKSVGGAYVATGFCCVRQQWDGQRWVVEAQHEQVVTSYLEYAFTEASIDWYVRTFPECLTTAGALCVEGLGASFIRTVHGSYTTIIGLPLVEVREALETLGFFRHDSFTDN